MFFFSSKNRKQSYIRLPRSSSHDEELETQRAGASPSCRTIRYLELLSYAVLLILVGFFLGESFAQRGSSFSGSLSLAMKPRMFKYVQTFGGRPSNRSNTAWEELFPKRGGFFNHPKIAPDRSAYAVFHQLHCLNALREGYWKVLDAASSSTPLDIDTIPFEISPPHMRHCIDLLRQTLMCSPDLTVEVKDETLGGVTGFGTVHQCRDWSQLMGWMEEWQDVGAPKHAPSGHEHAHHHGPM